MYRRSLSVAEIDFKKYTYMYSVQLALVHLNEKHAPCFSCYEFHEVDHHPHYHTFDGTASITPAPLTKNLKFIKPELATPEFLDRFDAAMLEIHGTNDYDELFRLHSPDLIAAYEKNCAIGRKYTRASSGFGSISNLKSTIYVDESLTLSCVSDRQQRIVDRSRIEILHIDEI